jgi:hypothetical protein
MVPRARALSFLLAVAVAARRPTWTRRARYRARRAHQPRIEHAPGRPGRSQPEGRRVVVVAVLVARSRHCSQKARVRPSCARRAALVSSSPPLVAAVPLPGRLAIPAWFGPNRPGGRLSGGPIPVAPCLSPVPYSNGLIAHPPPSRQQSSTGDGIALGADPLHSLGLRSAARGRSAAAGPAADDGGPRRLAQAPRMAMDVDARPPARWAWAKDPARTGWAGQSKLANVCGRSWPANQRRPGVSGPWMATGRNRSSLRATDGAKLPPDEGPHRFVEDWPPLLSRAGRSCPARRRAHMAGCLGSPLRHQTVDLNTMRRPSLLASPHPARGEARASVDRQRG